MKSIFNIKLKVVKAACYLVGLVGFFVVVFDLIGMSTSAQYIFNGIYFLVIIPILYFILTNLAEPETDNHLMR